MTPALSAPRGPTTMSGDSCPEPHRYWCAIETPAGRFQPISCDGRIAWLWEPKR